MQILLFVVTMQTSVEIVKELYIRKILFQYLSIQNNNREGIFERALQNIHQSIFMRQVT